MRHTRRTGSKCRTQKSPYSSTSIWPRFSHSHYIHQLQTSNFFVSRCCKSAAEIKERLQGIICLELSCHIQIVVKSIWQSPFPLRSWQQHAKLEHHHSSCPKVQTVVHNATYRFRIPKFCISIACQEWESDAVLVCFCISLIVVLHGKENYYTECWMESCCCAEVHGTT